MKVRFVKFFFGSLILLCCSFVHAQQITKFGVVDTAKVYNAYFRNSAPVRNYEKKKAESENVICALQEKIAAGEKLSDKEEADRYDAELYLSELDLDSSARGILINTRTLKDIDEMLSLARTIVEKHKK